MSDDNDLDGEVISLNNPGETDIDQLTDRGDEVNPELNPDKLKAVIDNADELDDSTDPEPAEPAPTEQDDPRQSGGRIPKARFDEVNTERKEAIREAAEAKARAELLERELEQLRAASARPAAAPDVPPEPTFDEDAKEAEYIEAMLNGDATLAKQIRREINQHIKATAEAAAIASTQAELAQRTAEAERRTVAANLQAASAQAIADYPYLDTAEGAMALKLIVAARDADIAAGVPPHIALAEAVKAIAPKFAPDTPARESTGGKGAGDTRTAAAIARGATDSQLQPPAVQAGIGARAGGGRINVNAMTDEQFDNLSEADKKRLRGD